MSDSGTTVQADNVLLGGFNSGIFGGTATLTINNSAQVTAGSDTDFFTSTSTLIVDKATLTTARLGTFDGAVPLIQITNLSSSSMALTINNADINMTETYSGTIADTADGAGGILKTGAGTQILSGHSTYTGGTTINAGTLQTGAADALPASGAVTLGGGTFDLGGNVEHIGSLTLTSGTLSGANGSALMATAATLKAGTISVPIFSSGAISKQTTGTVTDTAVVSASSLTVAQGIFDAQGGVNAAVSVSSGAQLKLRGNMAGSLSAVAGGTITLTGATIVAGATTVSGTLDVNNQTVVFNTGDNPQVATTTIAGGLISSADGYTLLGPLSGYGTVASNVSSGTGANSAAASGGTLAIGTYAAADSLVSYTGSLAAGSQQLNLASSGYTTLGSSATIAGGSINSVNGVRVKSAMALSGNGAVNGPLDNQGTVMGGTGSDVLHLTGKVTGGGSFTQNVSFEGSYSPGNSPAAVSLGGPTTFAATNQLLLEIGGTTAGTQYDHISAADALTLGGALKVSLIGGFAPAAGESFDLLDFDPSKLSGTFSSIVLPTLSAGLQWNADQLYATGAVSVNLLGDYNGNGVVDAADYTIYRAELGRSGIGLSADGNGNNVIDSGDFDIWASHFGGHVGSGAGATTSVPEPSAAALLVTGFACLIARRRRRG